MTITLKRQLTDSEKQTVLQQHGRTCYSTGHSISEDEQIHFDHIKAFSLGGASDTTNIAPMCATHNKEKGQLSLFDFRTKLRLKEFFSLGDKLTLKNLLEYLREKEEIQNFGQAITISSIDGNGAVKVSSANTSFETTLQQCPATGWKYFYCILDVTLITSDDDEEGAIGLQPRYLIEDKVFDLFRHFQTHPVLQPSIGRLVKSSIRVFDGQHKIAALLWNGRTKFECKVYVDSELRLLNQTNIAAHDKYAQTRFFSSVMVNKLGSQFGQDFVAYKELKDGSSKSEAAFIAWLRKKDSALTTAQINERFRSYLDNAVLDHDDNRLGALISASNRSTDKKPITIDMLKKSLLAGFLYRDPVSEDLAGSGYKREIEINNLLVIMNMMYDQAFKHWNTETGAFLATQMRLSRMLRSKSIMAWSGLFIDAVIAKLDLNDSEERARPLYREISEGQLKQISAVFTRLYDWKRWDAPEGDEIDRVLSDNRSEVRVWFKSHGLTTGYLLGAPE
jgi:hypothetical protein